MNNKTVQKSFINHIIMGNYGYKSLGKKLFIINDYFNGKFEKEND